MNTKLKSIFQYADYRQFLRDFYLFQKQLKPHYSYKQFSISAHLKSPNYLALVITGERNLTVANIHQFALALGFIGNEHAFFEALVLMNQAETLTERKYYQRRLLALKREVPGKKIKLSERSVIKEWYFPAVLLCLKISNAGDQAEMIAKRLNIARSHIDAALQELAAMKIIECSANGQYSFHEDHFLYADANPNVAQRQYLKKQLQLAQTLFDGLYDAGGTYFSHTFTGPKDFNATNRIMALIEQLTQEADACPPERIFQLNFQLFPLDRR